MTDDRLISAKDVALLYGVDREATVRQWADAGRIPRPVVRQKKYTRWSRNEVLEHIEQLKRAERNELVA